MFRFWTTSETTTSFPKLKVSVLAISKTLQNLQEFQNTPKFLDLFATGSEVLLITEDYETGEG